jgi:two-component system, NtrC family, sensor kinase
MSSAASADAMTGSLRDQAASGVVNTFYFLARAIAVAAVVLALLVLTGWQFDIEVLKRIIWSPHRANSLAAMNPSTAAAVALGGVSLWSRCRFARDRRTRSVAVCAAAVTALVGALKLVALLHGPDLGVDRIFFTAHDVASNPMAPNTAVCLLLCGTALMTIDVRLRHGVRPAQVLALTCMALTLFAVVGYAFSVSSLYYVPTFFPMALHSAAILLLLAAGILFARPNSGVMLVLSADDTAGALARRLLPASLVIPAIIGWLGETAGRQGWLGEVAQRQPASTTRLQLPLIVLADTVIFTALLWIELDLLRRADQQRQNTEKALRNSEARTRLVIDSARDAFIAMDASGTIVDWNPQAQEMFGFSRAQALGKSPAQTIIPEPYRRGFQQGLARFLQSGEGPFMGKRMELTALHQDGREFPVEMVVSPARIENAWFFFAFIHDITQRKRVAEERDRFFTLSRDIVCVSNFDGYFVRVNGACQTILGHTPEEMMQTRWIEFVHPEDQEATLAEARKLAAGAVTLSFENRYRCKDGAYKWLSWMSVPVVKDGVLYAVARDMTERKRVEGELREKNRLLEEVIDSERAARIALQAAQGQLVQSEKLAGLGQMVAGVAHEINNPLAFVSNNVAVLHRDVGSVAGILALYEQAEAADETNRRLLLEEIHRVAERVDLVYTLSNLTDLIDRSREGLRRIQQIVKDLRDFARLDQGDLQEADLNAGIESTINIVRGHAKKRHVEIKAELGPLPPYRCYAAKLNQVVMNLIVNAIDASHDGSSVFVRSAADSTGIRIDVVDSGQGIEPAIRERIFDPFFTTKPIGQGTGLGLSISYGIIRDHKGRIEVQSEVGQGSTFSVRLPTPDAVPQETKDV